MNSLLFSIESNDRNERVGPNQFCLSLFKNRSFEDMLWCPAQLEAYTSDDKQISHNISNFFQMQFNSRQLDAKLPSLDLFIKKEEVPSPKRISAATRDYKKNICRNILRHAIKALSSPQSIEFLLGFMNPLDTLQFVQVYSQKLEYISGFRVLKDEIVPKQDDSTETRTRKEYFRKYLEWFARERASIYIIKGEASNIKEYLTYKNEVLMYYIQCPKEWYSNKPLWRVVERKPKAERRRKIKKQG